MTLTDRLREIFKSPLDRIGLALYQAGIRPNMITIFGFLGTLVGTFFVARGELMLGAALIMVMGPIDALDGAVARAGGVVTKFGAFLDSVIDRYIESFIYGALAYYFLNEQNSLGVLLAFFALVGSVMVSYTRARAQSLGFETKVGILTRFERLVVIGPTVFFQIPMIGVGIVAVLANITALQRMFHVKQQSDATE